MKSILKKLRNSYLHWAHGNDYPRLIATRAIERPNYGYIIYWAADLARRLGVPRISMLEFGVAGGNGLVNMEAQAERVQAITGVAIDVYGFDTGEGLPPPVDYRDLPYIWQSQHFKMDQQALQQRLKRAKLVLGLVDDSVKTFVEQHNPAPIGAISFDLDYHSSTVQAFQIFDVPAERRLPRILCYMDDCMSSDLGHVGPTVGVPLAIDEFNAEHFPRRSLSKLVHLPYSYQPARSWHQRIYSFADIDHPDADRYIMGSDRQLSL